MPCWQGQPPQLAALARSITLHHGDSHRLVKGVLHHWADNLIFLPIRIQGQLFNAQSLFLFIVTLKYSYSYGTQCMGEECHKMVPTFEKLIIQPAVQNMTTE